MRDRPDPRAYQAATCLVCLALMVVTLGCATVAQRWRAAAIGVQVADVALSHAIIADGGTEMNPLAGQDKLLPLKVAVVAVLAWYLSDKPEAQQVKAWKAFALIGMVPVAWNMTQLGR